MPLLACNEALHASAETLLALSGSLYAYDEALHACNEALHGYNGPLLADNASMYAYNEPLHACNEALHACNRNCTARNPKQKLTLEGARRCKGEHGGYAIGRNEA